MYPNLTNVQANLRTNRNLSEYARLEYGPGHAEWLLAAARRDARPAARPRRWTLLFARKAKTGLRPLPHKGSPRGQPFEAPAQG